MVCEHMAAQPEFLLRTMAFIPEHASHSDGTRVRVCVCGQWDSLI